ncbi:SDR family NAD(P)-dependent oxidoreductase [Pseudonocardia nigra]|uniref:SDR family NAD(P)-dependent oxidoreductase n=1 Tax=Pseudonocardia nigra TaxID=1921578 RepID=UPI001C5E4E78|nr:SDR family NAD(P)-dependent oxidoreductase [Pseudonocardia nigra]
MTTPEEVFAGGVAVITGAGAGIGEGLALHAALRLGMTVAVADVDGSAAERVAARITADGGRALAHAVDVRDPAAMERLAERVAAGAGPVRLLVNNAGVEQFGYLWDTPVANWHRLVDINVNGVFHGLRAFLPRMIANPGRSVVLNMSSVGGVAAVPLQAAYVMSKHAVLALTESLHLELAAVGANVGAHAVLPGVVASDIFASARGVDGGDTGAAERARDGRAPGARDHPGGGRRGDLRPGGPRRVLRPHPARGRAAGDGGPGRAAGEPGGTAPAPQPLPPGRRMTHLRGGYRRRCGSPCR